MTIRNGQSRDTDIDIHKKKTLHTEQDVRDKTIRNGQSRDTDIDIHKKKTLERQSGMDNLETLIDIHKKKTSEIDNQELEIQRH